MADARAVASPRPPIIMPSNHVPLPFARRREHHRFGKDEVESGDYAENLAATMLASTLGKSSTRMLRGTNASRSMERAA